MIKKRIEKEQQLEIANKYRSGHTLSKLSVEYGISVSPIRKILQSLNVPIRRKGKITDSSPERDKKIHDLYKNKDITLQEIGDIYNLSRERIRQIVEYVDAS